MRRISLEQLITQSRKQTYIEQYEYIRNLLEDEQIKEVKASPRNGKKPALHLEYWLVEQQEDYEELEEELQFRIVPAIETDYYLHHLSSYKEDRLWVQLLNGFLKNQSERLKESVSINERSFQIWQREKFIKEEAGKRILKRCGISLEQLNVYETAEPLSYYVHYRTNPQNLLIIENKDTFYSMRKFLLQNGGDILGIPFGTLIYGGGKRIQRTFTDDSLCMEPYMKKAENKFYYFGDLDYEGIGIYEKLAKAVEEQIIIYPFSQAYQAMLMKAAQLGKMPETKEKQNRHIDGRFWEFFDDVTKQEMIQVLEDGRYIPQEILNVYDF